MLPCSVLSHSEASLLVFLWGWWQQQQHFLPPSFEHPELRTLPVCETGRLEVPSFSGWESSCTHTQSWAHWWARSWTTGSLWPGACTCLFWHPASSRSLHFGVHTACLTRCCWIRRHPPLKLLLKPLKVTAVLPKTSPHCPAAWLHFGQEHSRI